MVRTAPTELILAMGTRGTSGNRETCACPGQPGLFHFQTVFECAKLGKVICLIFRMEVHMKSTGVTLFELLVTAETAQARQEAREAAERNGYSYFNEFIEALRDRMKRADEEEMPEMHALLAKAKETLPEPGTVSPSWEFLWTELEDLLFHKAEAFREIPRDERGGEWQIVMDNPFTNESVVCYPGLSFLEAIYLYGYFRPGLKQNEYIRVQKIISKLERNGG
jgi:hypothetical protein